MLTVSSLLITLGVTLTLGIVLTLYFWQIRRKQHETRQGLITLAGMRWREFSHFVIAALQAQGFDADPLQASPQSGQKSDLRLTRDGRSWLLSCKQGVNYRINAEHVSTLASSVSFHGAGGGIIATLGDVQSDARKNNQGLELLDGKAVWALVEHLLPNGLHEAVAQHARRRALTEIAIGWCIAAAVGLAAAVMLAPTTEVGQPVSPAPAAEPTATAPSAVQAPAPAQANLPPAHDEQAQRELIILRVDALKGVRRAVWSTRSTLRVDLGESVVDGPAITAPICEILGEYPDLRSSRVQLQPYEGSTQAVRFLQCHQY